MFLNVMEQKELIKEFPNKGWRPWGLNKLLKTEARNWHKARLSRSIESIQNISCLAVLQFSYTNGIL